MRRVLTCPGIVRLSLGMSCMALLFWCKTIQAQEFLENEAPPPASVQESKTPMDEAFKKPAERTPLLTGVKEKMKDETPFIRDTRIDVNPRTYYFHQAPFTDNIKEAWAIGGSIAYRSGYLFDHFGVGAAAYTSQALHAPDDRDGTLLLKPEQTGYAVLGQLYGDIRLVDDMHLYLFRKEYDTPYINKNDTRMTPNTFEGYTLVGRYSGASGVPAIRYGAGYITRIKKRNSDDFVPMSVAAGVDKVDRGVALTGANYSTDKYSIGAINYYSNDIINIFYTEGKCLLPAIQKLGFLVSAQLSDQRSTGDNLITGNDFSGHQVGFKAEASYEGAVLTFAYTNTTKGTDMRSPWSGYPGYTSVQVQDFNRAGEEATMIKVSSHLSRFGFKGVTIYGLWVHGWGAVDSVSRTPVYNQDEYDIDLQWRPKIVDFLKGFWFRTRYAYVDQRGAGNSSVNDFRIIVNYDLPLL